jgi:hypothetical protein
MDVRNPEEFIEMVSQKLLEFFSQNLSKLNTQTNYAVHVGNLAEILDWSQEFFDNYYPNINNWTLFAKSEENIFKADTFEEFILAFGHVRFVKFCLNHGDSNAYFLNKYELLYKQNVDQ